MTFDEQLAARVRKSLPKRTALTEKKMFGGLAFLLNGNMCCGVHQDSLIVRLAGQGTDEALSRPHTRVFDLSGGRPMKGWILVDAPGVATDADLRAWIDLSIAYAGSLPPK